MNDLERLWRERNDGALLEAAENLDDYTEEAERVIVAEMARRGLRMPEPPDADAEDEDEEIQEKEAPAPRQGVEVPVEGPLACVRCGLELQYLGSLSLEKRVTDVKPGLLVGLARLLEGEESLNVYMCSQCGHLDFFANGEAEDDEA